MTADLPPTVAFVPDRRADENDLAAPAPTRREVARFRAYLGVLNGQLHERFIDQRLSRDNRRAIEEYAADYCQRCGYAFRCRATADGTAVTIHLRPLTLHAGRLLIAAHQEAVKEADAR